MILEIVTEIKITIDHAMHGAFVKILHRVKPLSVEVDMYMEHCTNCIFMV